MFKLICALSLIVLLCHQLEAAPNANKKTLVDMSQSELMNKFEQFMHEDKQAAEIRQLYEQEMHEHKLRKRQTEMDGEGAMEPDVNASEAGFLDRAAKFVMELVQRFLKWINTD